MKKTVTICFANNKGGSGKTTTCSNVGYALAELGKKVLLIDGDMQMNLSLSYFEEEQVLEYAYNEQNLYHAIKNQDDLLKYVRKTKYENVDLIPSSILMSSMEYELFTKFQRELILKKCMKTIQESGTYDYILIDAPPNLGGWVINLLVTSDYLIVPVEASPWGLFGLANMFEYLNVVKEINEDLELLGITITKVDTRKGYFKQTKEELLKVKGVRVFETFVRVDSSIEWAQDKSIPVAAYKRNSRSTKEYIELAKEIMKYGSRKR